jgi:hypothetical protein
MKNPASLTAAELRSQYPRWVRMSTAIEILGIPRCEFKKLVDNAVVRPIYLVSGGRAHYSVAELIAIIEQRTP